MALQSSGQISLSDVRDEFLGSNPVSIDDYINFRTDGRRVGTDTSLALSDYYDGNNSALLETTMTVGESDFNGEKRYVTTITVSVQTPTPTSYQTPTTVTYEFPTTVLRGFDGPQGNDTDYLYYVRNGTAVPSTIYSQSTDVFGSMTNTTFSSVTIKGLYWSEQFEKLYLIHSGTSNPSFDSLTVNGSAYVKGALGYTTFLTNRNESSDYRVHRWVAEYDPFPSTNSTCTIYITP